MSKLIENIKRLAGMIKNETKSGGNTAARVGGLFEEISDELELKYDRDESDRIMREHDTATGSHQNIQDAVEERIAGVDRDLTQNIEEMNTSLSGVIADGDKLLTDAIAETRKELSESITEGNTKLSGLIAGTNADLKGHKEDTSIHQTSAQIRADIADGDIPATLARVADVDTKDANALQAAKEYAAAKIAEVVNSAPGTLDTLQELANALGNDPNFATSIMALIGGKADTAHYHSKSQISDFPVNMPASDVYDWAKQPGKPGYSAAEVGAAPAGHDHHGVYQPAGNYAAGEHNHNGVYQPAGDYAPASHNHVASQVTEETNKRFMTDDERSKLAGIEAEANKYVHPEDTNIRHVTDAEKEKWNSNKNLSVQSNGTGNAVTSLSYNSTSGTLIQNKSATFLLQSDAAQQNMPTGTSSNTIVSIAPVTYIRIDNGVSTMIDTSVLQGGQIFAITLIAGGRLGHNIYGERGGMIRLNMVYPEDRFVLAVWDAQKLGLRHLFGTNDVL